MSDQQRPDNVTSLQSHRDAELEALYQQAPKAEPSKALDTKILAAARQAKPRRKPVYPWFAGLAASLMVAVIVVRLVPEVERLDDAVMYESEPPAAMSAPLEQEETLQQAPVRMMSPKPAAPPAKMFQPEAESRSLLKESARSPNVTANIDGFAESNDQGRAAGAQDLAVPSAISASPALHTAPRQTLPAEALPPEYQFLPPEALLEQIKALIHEQKFAEAVTIYRQLKQRYPGYQMDLKDQELLKRYPQWFGEN